jgi:2-polyprenyl-6-methoxyphenol hydroxylase-like FAD-dependent oxidoreductase
MQRTANKEVETTSVLVVGGSLVGLSAAMFLASRKVPTILVERYPGSSAHPRAIGYTPRTLELFHSVGLAVPEAPPDFRLRRVRVESLAGKWFDESAWNPTEKPAQKEAPIKYSLFRGSAIAQDVLEPMIRKRTIELGADVRLQTELISFEQDDKQVIARLRRKDGTQYEVRAAYMVAADGNRSQVREALGIGRKGRGAIRTVRSVMFRAPLEKYLEAGAIQFAIDQPDLQAVLAYYMDGRWMLMFSDDEERDAATLMSLIEKAIGRPEPEVEIITTGRWELGAFIADSFSSGRVFLAGDAAHTLPPSRGGYGANTGIEDAHNLSWKLEAVLAGVSSPELLATYDAERRPIAWLRHNQIFARPDYKAVSRGASDEVAIIDDDAMEFGQLYRSKAVAGVSESLPPALRPDQWAGQPGTRAPFARLKDGRSTLDLYQRGWLVLAVDDAWRDAVATASQRIGVPVEYQLIDQDLHTLFGIGRSGAVVIRPDGYIGTRFNDMAINLVRVMAYSIAFMACVPTMPT